ncbi:alpha/beta hydrolase, partial [Listeria monocytogenes]|nr:alpha/beta hydrolase [Listeria monocytogenes]EAE2355665.1 alpha/beta hydrolase [Listeria monocytogenes]
IDKLYELRESFDFSLFMKSRKAEINMSKNKQFYQNLENHSLSEKDVLIIKGADDVIVSDSEIADFLSKTNLSANVKVIGDSKHWIHVDNQKIFTELVKTFI